VVTIGFGTVAGGAGHVNCRYAFDRLKGIAAILKRTKSQSPALTKDHNE
jgi:hypothetical protein